MSTDTMYFNSSRLKQSAGKNKTNYLQKPDKRRHGSNKKNKVRQEGATGNDVPLPMPQALPNGEKPDFGNSSKKGNKNQGDRRPASKKTDRDADKLSHDLQEMLSVTDTNRKKEVLPSKGESSVSNGSPQLLTPQSMPTSGVSPGVSPLPIFCPPPLSVSPLPLHPGLYQHPYQQHAQQLHPQQSFNGPIPGYPYSGPQPPNYALSSGGLPNFTTPQAALMNPMQHPMNYFPVPHPAMATQVPHAQPYNYNLPQNHQIPSQGRTAPSSSGSSSSSKRSGSASKKQSNRKSSGSGGYAGASFATSVPEITNLPKPSFA